MTVKIFIILACVPLYVLNSFCDKYVSSLEQNRHNVFYNCVKFLLCTLFLLPVFLADSSQKFGLGALMCGILCGIMYAISKTVILKGYEKTSVAFMTLCHASGMIVPCIAGHFFWNEKLGLFSVAGILTVVISVVLLKSGGDEKKEFKLQGVFAGVAVFITSGGVMIAQKLMGLYFTEESVSAYNLYSFAVTFLILCFFVKPKSGSVSKANFKAVIFPAAGSAISLCIISVVMTGLAGSVPSVILFPLFNGLGIIFVYITSLIVFKEKFTLKKALGMLCGVCGLCLINL